MAKASEWLEGARPRTWAAAFSPVIAGSALAVFYRGFHPGRAGLALGVALALQIGVNFANDYSDGVRGSDAVRVGPQRLVGSGAARPGQVKAAAFGCFTLACLLGLWLVAICGHWWLLIVGAACVLAAWYYTGGKHPYGYVGLGEVFVFIFFGLVAVCGTIYVQTGWVGVAGLLAGIGIGALACAVLVTNNLRDIAGDARVGKRTLATRLGDRGTRVFFVLLVAVAVVCAVLVALATTWWALLGLASLVFLWPAGRVILGGQSGLQLVRTLKFTGFGQLAWAIGLLVGCLIGA